MTSQSSATITGLAFRRQFLIGPESSELVPNWTRHSVGQGLALAVHPDLQYVRVDLGERSLILLGFVLDPEHPERDDVAILRQLLHATTSLAEVLKAFDPLAGRWAAVYLTGDQVVAFHDAAGLRSIYYHRDHQDAIWLGSTAGLVSRLTGTPEDSRTRQELVRDGALRPTSNHFWPGTGSAFIGVNRLLPNHYLDIRSGQAQRYWPSAAIQPVSPDEAVDRCAAVFTGVIAAAAARYRLALAMTAGLDSRLLLAASRAQAAQMSFYTLRKTNTKNRSGDIRVPQKMLPGLGLRHQVIPVQFESTGPVVNAIQSMFSPFHRRTADQAAALSATPPRTDGEWVTVNGNVSEIARYPDFTLGFKSQAATPENLALNVNMGASSFAAAQLGAWHENAKPALESSGVDVWDLLYWEQKLGAWLATVRAEFDVVEEGVTPYNSRALLECLLGVDASLRSAPDYELHRRVIVRMWPEVLDYPVNPPPRSSVLKNAYRAVLRRLKPGGQP